MYQILGRSHITQDHGVILDFFKLLVYKQFVA